MMVFSKRFPRTIKGSTYPIWEEIILNSDEEEQVEKENRKDIMNTMKECVDDAKQIISDKNLKDYQSDIISLAISLFEKRASHDVFKKEQKAKEKFDEKFPKD